MTIVTTETKVRATRALLLSAAATLLPTLAAPASAQDVAPGAAAPDQQSHNNDIIVTAQRRNERLEDVPMSVAVVTQETLAASGVTSLRDISNVTSGIQIGAGGAFPQPSIRGVTTIINGTYENNVAVYIDDLYEPVAQAINIDLPNVESVQVLKGPQGTLYGRNATGGAILLTTIMPTDTWRGKAELTYARFDDKRASGYVAGPLSDIVGASVAGYIRRSDGYNRLTSRTTPGASGCCATPIGQDALRFKLRAEFSPIFSATLMYNYTRVNDSRSNVYSPIENVPALYLQPGGATRPTTLGVQAYDLGDVMDVEQNEGGLVLQWNTGIGTLKSITGYSKVITDNRFDFDGSYIPSSYSSVKIRERTFQESVNYNITAIDRLDLTLGGLYFLDKVDYLDPQINFVGTNPANPGTTPGTIANYSVFSQSDFKQRKEAWALYADATYHLTDQLSLNVGGRYSHEVQNVYAVTSSGLASFVRPVNNQMATFRKFTPRASIRYEVAPRTNIYFSYSQGFRTGAFNAQQPATVLSVGPSAYAPAAPETISAYELGFKTAGGHYRFELSGFYYDYKNLQVSATKSVNGFPFVDVTNAPKAKIYGIDASFEIEPIEHLTVRGNATWLHARYGDGFQFSGAGVCLVGAGCGVGINTNSDPLRTYLNQSQLQDLSGLQMARAPDFSANLGLDYLVPIGAGGVRFAANVKYTSSYVVTNPSIWCQPLASNTNCAGIPADRQGQQRFREGPYALVNASITWTDPSDHYYVRAWGTNLTDHKYRLHYSGTASNGTYEPMAEPLLFGGTIGFKFDGGRRAAE